VTSRRCALGGGRQSGRHVCREADHTSEEGLMERGEKRVDGFRFLPPGLRVWIRSFIPRGDFTGPIPWTPLAKPLRQATMGLVTSAGISLKTDPPFDMEREKREPTWGTDPSGRSPDVPWTCARSLVSGRPDLSRLFVMETLRDKNKEDFYDRVCARSRRWHGSWC
jgi:hypothetical protein